MKISVSLEEAQKMLSHQIPIMLGARAINIEEIELEITPPVSTTVKMIDLKAIVEAGQEVYDEAGMGASAKIEAIKTIHSEAARQGVSVGFADAEWFVENVIMK